MKRAFLILFLLLTVSGLAVAQTLIINSDTFRPTEYDVTVAVQDSLSGDPMGFVSVYLRAKGDTLITNFTLSDPSGKARLENVNRGHYMLVAEMLGYRTGEKEVYISRDDDKLAVIKMVENPELIDAASISAVGNPIEIRKDTIIYNASSFKVGSNAMLEDLLKRMPGVEVKDGSVTVNGEAVNKITVGGRTFFFGDQSMALKNLPARIVDKIKVIDKKNEDAEFTGIVQEKEKVLDVEVKKEFSKGWFGNVSGAGGTSLAAKDDAEDRLITKRDLLYQSNALASYYDEKDQLTIVGNAYNVATSTDYMLFGINNDGEEHPRGGLPIYTQLGANYNTLKLKNMDLTAMANYKHSVADVKSSSNRTTFLAGGDELQNRNLDMDLFGEHTGEVIFELKNTRRDKFMAYFKQQFTFNAVDREKGSENAASDRTGGLNSSVSNSYLKSRFWLTRTDFTLGWKNFGKDRRAFTMTGAFFYNDKDSGSKEFSKTWFGAGGAPEVKDLYYKGDNEDLGFKLNLNWVEPLSDNWSVSAEVNSFASFKDTYKNAFDRTSGVSRFTATVDDAGCFTKPNDYYSSLMDNDYLYIKERVQGQYSKDAVTLQFGVSLQETYNETFSKSLGVSQTIGKDEWLLDWAPFLQFRWGKGQRYLNAGYSGSSTQQTASSMMPVLNITVPTRLSMGNVYLLPSFSNNANISYSVSNKKTFSHFYIFGNFGATSRGIVNASWFDTKGVYYSIPVNSGKPSMTARLNVNWGRPVNEDKTWSVQIAPSFTYNRSVSYQSTAKLAALDPATFDYNKFMADFWGPDASGERFYSGKSGFNESLTRGLTSNLGLLFIYNGEHIGMYTGVSATSRISRYSLDNAADQNLWNFRPSLRLSYRTEGGFNAETELDATFYAGYPEGANKPFIGWSARISKDIKAFNIGLLVDNILNQNNFIHTVSENYVQDSYSTSFGRLFLISLKYNFGKLNQARRGAAQQAAFRMN